MELTLNRICITQLKDGSKAYCIEIMHNDDYSICDLNDITLTGLDILSSFVHQVRQGCGGVDEIAQVACGYLTDGNKDDRITIEGETFTYDQYKDIVNPTVDISDLSDDCDCPACGAIEAIKHCRDSGRDDERYECQVCDEQWFITKKVN
jgi:predicted RNA-binding Zn-ribbon protein involved in translation (DUF1610 family)